MSEQPAPADPGFAPSDYSDGRRLGEWQSRYPAEAWTQIYREAFYLVALMLIVALVMVLVSGDHFRFWMPAAKTEQVKQYSFAAFGGILGGTTFGMKWLYHSVAKELWNEDRRLWRLFSPVIAGALSFGIFAVVRSSEILDPALLTSVLKTTGFAFLTGLFSDNALAKLAEFAEIVFGQSRKDTRHRPR